MDRKIYLVTGCAGFIGFHLTKKLLANCNKVVGIDNLNDYYDPRLKLDRLKQLKDKNFVFEKEDISNSENLFKIFGKYQPEVVCHLAAQAGVRYSLEKPLEYERSNILGFLNILEAMRKYEVKNLVYASSSSVYGGINKETLQEDIKIDKPLSLYAATKAANELYAHVYHHLFGLNCIGLRFFTVYGPWGRPDMAAIKFARAITEDKKIEIYNYGKMKRDFTYVDDIVDGIIAAANKVETIGWGIYNLGNSRPVELMKLVELLEKYLGKIAIKEFLPLQPGDMLSTCADINRAKKDLGYSPNVTIEEGIARFVEWFKGYC